MNKIPLYYYVAFNNPDGTKAAIESFGLMVLNVKDRSDLAQCAKQFIQLKGHDAIDALAKVHPDRDLILDSVQGTKSLGADGDQLAITNGQPAAGNQQPAVSSQHQDYTPLLIAGMFLSALVITAAIIVKK